MFDCIMLIYISNVKEITTVTSKRIIGLVRYQFSLCIDTPFDIKMYFLQATPSTPRHFTFLQI